MKNYVLFLFIVILTLIPRLTIAQDTTKAATAQQSQTDTTTATATENTDKAALNFGVLMGGGGLIGADLEVLVYRGLGLQIGAGLGSLGFGINYHFNNKINSQFFSIQYFQQGFGTEHYGTYVGPMYVYRYKKYFQAGIGFGSVLSTGPAWTNSEKTSIVLLYNIGLYFPL